MTNTPMPPKRIVLKANRDTLMLVAAASAATLALAASVHSRPQPDPTHSVVEAPQQDWTGDLAELVPASTEPTEQEPLTSASLTVPKSALALPNPPTRAKAKPCDVGPCPTSRPAALRTQAARAEAARASRKDHSLMARLNPFNHLDTLQKPFVYAGNSISNWLHSF